MAYLPLKDGRSPGSMMLKASLAALMAMCAIFVVYEVVDDSHIEVERDYDDGDYEYDPFDTDPADDANFKPDKEGQAPPTPNWHACRFAAKKGGIYDIRPLSRNKKLLNAASSMFNKYDLESVDWVHQDDTIANQTYYLNVCSDVIAVPPACRELQKMDPAPAFDVTPSGECFYLGTLKTFQWRPIDTNTPNKGMELFYENGESCGLGKKRKIKFVFTCSKYFTLNDGPMVVFQHPNVCEYEVQWPSPVGCPHTPVLHQLGLQEQTGGTSSTGKALFVVILLLAGGGVAAYFYKKQQEKGGHDYT